MAIHEYGMTGAYAPPRIAEHAKQFSSEMLAMPHRQNERLLVLIEPMWIRRLHREAAGHPHKTQILDAAVPAPRISVQGLDLASYRRRDQRHRR
jgi:hypothetical protein